MDRIDYWDLAQLQAKARRERAEVVACYLARFVAWVDRLLHGRPARPARVARAAPCA